MNILVVGHSFINSFAHRKYQSMMLIDKSIRVNIIIPDSFNHLFSKFIYSNSNTTVDWIFPVKRFFNGNMFYILNPIKLYSLIVKLSPDIIHIEEDPHSFISIELQLILLIIKKKHIVSYFIWDNINRRPKFPIGIIKKILTSYSLNNSDGVVCGNRRAQHLLLYEKKFFKLSDVIPQFGINILEFNNKSKRLNKVINIGYIGRLVNEKGIFSLLDALFELQELNWKLIIVGNGPLRKELERRTLDFRPNRIEIYKACKFSEVPLILSNLDIFVLPSLTTSTWVEQFGLTLAQAMASGIACIGSSSGAIPELLGNAGLIFKEGNDVDLRTCITKLLLQDNQRRELGFRASSRVQEFFSEEVISMKYINYFKLLFFKYDV